MKNRELTSQSKVDKPKRMRAREHAIWNAVYASEYSRRFGAIYNSLLQEPQHPTESDFDRAINLMDAEGPSYVANAAVNDLREWRKDDNDG